MLHIKVKILRFDPEKDRKAHHALQVKYAAAVAALTGRAAEKGFVVGGLTGLGSNPPFATIAGKQTGYTEVVDQVRREVQAAKLVLEKERLKAQRTVLLLAVPKETMSIVDSMPTAQELMAKAVGAPAQLEGPK